MPGCGCLDPGEIWVVGLVVAALWLLWSGQSVEVVAATPSNKVSAICCALAPALRSALVARGVAAEAGRLAVLEVAGASPNDKSGGSGGSRGKVLTRQCPYLELSIHGESVDAGRFDGFRQK
jgi:hypothetical protein